MPSVGGMRRTTRVFGARVLRSGRRLSSPPSECVKRAKHGDEWIGLLESVGDHGGGGATTKCKKNGWIKKDSVPKQEKADQMDIDVVDRKAVDEQEPEAPVAETISPSSNMLRRWGVVYTRKRKRHVSVEGDVLTEDKRFGKHFVRKKKVKSAYAKDSDLSEDDGVLTDIVVVNTSYGSSYWVSCLLNSILRYLRRSTVSLQQIFGFINSNPLRDVYSLHGICLLQDQTHRKMKTGSCVVSAVRCSVPVFALDFSTVPCCFLYLHSSLLLRFVPMSNALVMYPKVALDEVKLTNDKEIVSCLTPLNNQSELDSKKIEVVNPTVGLHKLGARHLQLRNSRNIQKRRSSLRSRNGRHSSFGTQNANGISASDRLRFRRDGLRFSSRTSPYELRSSAQKTSKPSIKELKSVLVGLKKDVIDSTSCLANILVIEPDKCYREEGAVIAMELSAAKQWVLAVKIGGVRRFNLSTEKVMRPCSSNRVTHDIIWVGDSGWKLEFPDRQDWLIFKELYKECSDRNFVQPPAVTIIPVPGVREVSGYAESNPPDFSRPVSYITVKDDELARALARSAANYDMDYDDEEWLRNFNENEHLSAERFELLIDTFEKGLYCNPDDYSDEKAAVSSCLDKEKKEIVEAVYSYWLKKRKQNRSSSLIKIFQCYQPKRTQVIPKSILRKKRSFKRQGSQPGRGKQRPFLQAIVAEKDALQQQNAVLKVKEAKAAANKSEDLAVRMRQKAQQLMENADLATYKAMMALKIAEAAKIAKSTEAVASFFL
ncbi:uncharacterized protein LOC132616510 [Lycium barbarum]|uniref:uncharacterized protein LOC132616510 n=1 Tax=Lycium barbarum TaxID=112863 RepID=UPI00293F5FBE|nr:uncharacterized protein LOC132616510 [Lycium barbarum]XP_060186931.1 uncharacterized protein LOC132616510 [Lycium barbarum]